MNIPPVKTIAVLSRYLSPKLQIHLFIRLYIYSLNFPLFI